MEHYEPPRNNSSTAPLPPSLQPQTMHEECVTTEEGLWVTVSSGGDAPLPIIRWGLGW